MEAEQRAREQSCLLEAPAPNPRDTKKALDLSSGEYLCRRYAPTTFRGAPRTLLFLVPAGEDREPATDVETPTYGLFLEGEVAAIGGIEALQKAHAPYFATWARSGRHRKRRTVWPPLQQFTKPFRSPLPRRGGKTTLPRDTPRHRVPHVPTPTIFGCFCADMPQYGRTALSSRRAL